MSTMDAGTPPCRLTADVPNGTVVFMIGMRINALLRPRSWLPPFLAMPRMLRELKQHPDLGLLGDRTFFSGRVIMVVQYWTSMEHLMTYAANRDAEHLPAWRAFNRRLREAPGTIGIFHEAYEIRRDASHIVYVDMPPFGLGKASETIPAR